MYVCGHRVNTKSEDAMSEKSREKTSWGFVVIMLLVGAVLINWAIGLGEPKELKSWELWGPSKRRLASSRARTFIGSCRA